MKNKELTIQDFETIPPEAEKENKIQIKAFLVKKRRIIFASLSGIISLIILSLLFIKFKPSPKTPYQSSPQTLTPPGFQEEISLPQKESDIFRIEKEIEIIQKELEETNIKDNKLNPPVLDMNIKL